MSGDIRQFIEEQKLVILKEKQRLGLFKNENAEEVSQEVPIYSYVLLPLCIT